MAEKIVLKWIDSTVFEWDTGNVLHVRKVINLQRHHGDPVEIIGDGSTADLLRDKYKRYFVAKAAQEEYNGDIMGTASELLGVSKEKVEEDFKKATKRIRDPIGKLWNRVK